VNVTDFGSTLKNHPDEHGKLYARVTQVLADHLPECILEEHRLRHAAPDHERTRPEAAARRRRPRL
jgi:hypothetical protein